MLPYKPRNEAPLGWSIFLEAYLGASPTVAQRLWRLYATRCSSETLYVLHNVEASRHGVPLERVWSLIRPAMLFALTLSLSPERPGRSRDREIVELEASILRHFRPGVRQPWYS